MLYQTSDTTWGAAYNDYGGNSRYSGSPAGRAHKVSHNRPLSTRGNEYARTNFFANEQPMIRWLERNGYDVTYWSGADTARQRPSLIQQHRIFLSSGHDEYWSGEQRQHVESARDAGVNLAFFSGNQAFWKTRWESSIDGTGTAYRTLVSYKETLDRKRTDPTGVWTGTWRDPSFSPPADGGRPENALTGNIFTVNCCSRPLAITVPAEDGNLRLWRHTPVAGQPEGSTRIVGLNTVGFEWN